MTFEVKLPDRYINYSANTMIKYNPLFFQIVLSVVAVSSLAVIDAVKADENEDSDGDGITDIEEARKYRTDSQLYDTDLDGLSDGSEIEKYWTLPLVADTDGDGFLDGIEVRLGSDPTDPASSPDPRDPKSNDLDGDGIPNSIEIEHGSNPQHIDSDFDGLDDGAEINTYFTEPMLVDTDGDGIWDGEEVRIGTDPGNFDNPGG